MEKNLPKVNIVCETDNNISHAAQIIRKGGIIAHLTDTLYGLGADATNASAVAKVFKIKSRDKTKPLLILVESIEAAEEIGIFNIQAKQIAAAFWPGPLTLVLQRQEICCIAKEINPVSNTIAIRVPSRKKTLHLLSETSVPITGPSANLEGEEPADNAKDIMNIFGSKVDLILDAGVCHNIIPSTLVDLTSSKVRIIREGAILESQIKNIIAE